MSVLRKKTKTKLTINNNMNSGWLRVAHGGSEGHCRAPKRTSNENVVEYKFQTRKFCSSTQLCHSVTIALTETTSSDGVSRYPPCNNTTISLIDIKLGLGNPNKIYMRTSQAKFHDFTSRFYIKHLTHVNNGKIRCKDMRCALARFR